MDRTVTAGGSPFSYEEGGTKWTKENAYCK